MVNVNNLQDAHHLSIIPMNCVKVFQSIAQLMVKHAQIQVNVFHIYKKLCYWDGQVCSLADTCSKLPYESDEECRKAKSTCTVNYGLTGCMDGGNCKDMQKYTQCFWNKSMTIKCKWINGKCYDYICLNAPSTMTTDAECEAFLKGCTTQKGGGCTTRTTCAKAQVQNACVSDANNAQCTWMDTYCSDRYCSQASKTFTTNSQCDSFLKGCIAKPDGGCIQNRECDSALSQETCQFDIQGKPCIWNKTICQSKICKNAPIIQNIDHNYCEQFISSCIVQNINLFQLESPLNSVDFSLFLILILILAFIQKNKLSIQAKQMLDYIIIPLNLFSIENLVIFQSGQKLLKRLHNQLHSHYFEQIFQPTIKNL